MSRFLLALAVAAIAACGDQSPTRYVGTVMSADSPETAGTLALTLFSRDDTSFSGIMELGPPATGTGSAYAWHEGSELRISTVAATGGDTILWESKLTDAGLGGKYEFTGGDRVGQVGIWRARLTQGPPATPATLQLPQSVALPPLSALWPLVIVAVVAAWLARWIREAPQPVVADAPTSGSGVPLANWRPGPKGIGGWLAYFVFAHSVGAVVAFVRLVREASEYADAFAVGPAVSGMQPLVVFELAVAFLGPLVMIGGVVLALRESRFAPRYWFAYMTFSAVSVAVDQSLAIYINSEWTRLLGAADVEEAGATGETASTIWQLLVSVIWALYWARSERVRATFGAGALDRSRPPTPVTVNV